MKEKKNVSREKKKELSPEMKEFLEREKDRAKKNRIKNRPIVLMTYIMVVTFIALFGYLIYFVAHDSEKVVANSANKRQDSFSDFITRGKILSSDNVVLAETLLDNNGQEYRYYPYKGMFAHTVGYNSYGRAGIELQYNFELMRSHVNIVSKVSNDFYDTKNPGDNLKTTLNYKMTEAAANALGSAKGAVVVLDAKTSDVLVMYSSPTFDPNQIDTVWQEVHSDAGSNSTVLLNRATQGLYAPGSTFKVITALEYMRENKDFASYTHNCGGSDVFNSVSIRCSNNAAHGNLDLKGSLARSCNTSFANIGTNYIDIDKLNTLAERLLFNQKLPYDGNYSRSQFKLTGDSDISEIPQTVIGQGDTLITPLHNALIMQAIANKGEMMQPRLVKGIYSDDEALIKNVKTKSCGRVLDEDLCSDIIPMLQEVCKTGTASEYMSWKPYSVAGKTGTAEYDNNGNCNSWFVGFSNVEDPDIVISVVVEDYTSNHISGTSVASQVFDSYYNNNVKGY